MQQREPMPTAVPGRGTGRARRLLIGAVAVGVAAAAWVAAHRASGAAPAVVTSASAPKPALSGASTPPDLPVAPPAVATAASPAIAPASGPPVLPVETAAESLRKVQLALSGGSAQDDLAAAITLETCAHADKTATDLVQGRDAVKWLPPEVKKALGNLPPISDEMIERAQREQRRCQVFDAATLARRGEFYRRAYERGAEGAALFYLTWLTTDGAQDKPDPELMARLQAGVRGDAQAAFLPTLASFAFAGRYTADKAGADAVQAHAYKEAYFRIVEESSHGQSPSARELAARLPTAGQPEPALTQQQQRDAEALTLQIVSAWHQRRYP